MKIWGKAKRIPFELEYREVQPNDFDPDDRNAPFERVETLEGVLWAYPDRDYVMRGIEGELYPIKKSVFNALYEITIKCTSLRSLDIPRGHSARERGEESETDEAVPTGRFPGTSPQSIKHCPVCGDSLHLMDGKWICHGCCSTYEKEAVV